MKRTFTITINDETMPEKVREMITHTPDPTGATEGTYNIVLHKEDRPERQAAAFLHEVLHIWRQDPDSGKTSSRIEIEAAAEMQTIKNYL